MRQIAQDIWELTYPLSLLGFQVGRRVTLMRLASGRLVILSTAAFKPDDVEAMRALGEPSFLLEATKAHDSFAAAGRAAFPDIPYLVPAGFPKTAALRAAPLETAPSEWEGELAIRKIEGMPWVQEHVFFHKPSRTLIVADLLFNFAESSRLTQFVARHFMRLPDLVGMSVAFRMMIRDRDAFRRSLEDILQWDFDRIVVGHGAIIKSNGQERLRSVLRQAGLGAF